MPAISQSEADYPRTDPNAGSSAYYDSTFGKISRAVHAISSLPWMSDKITAEYFPGQRRHHKDGEEDTAQPTAQQPREPWYVRRAAMPPMLPPPMAMLPVSASIMLSPRPVYVSMSSATSSGSDSQSVERAPQLPPQMYMIPSEHGHAGMAPPFGAPAPVYYWTPPPMAQHGMSPPHPGAGFHPPGPPVIPMGPPPASMSHHRRSVSMSGPSSSSQLSPPQPAHYPRHARSSSGGSASGVSWVG